MSEFYEEVEIEDMVYDSASQSYTYPCPCGDNFIIGLDELLDGEDVAPCPSCTLTIRVIYEEEDLPEWNGDDDEYGEGDCGEQQGATELDRTDSGGKIRVAGEESSDDGSDDGSDSEESVLLQRTAKDEQQQPQQQPQHLDEEEEVISSDCDGDGDGDGDNDGDHDGGDDVGAGADASHVKEEAIGEDCETYNEPDSLEGAAPASAPAPPTPPVSDYAKEKKQDVGVEIEKYHQVDLKDVADNSATQRGCIEGLSNDAASEGNCSEERADCAPPKAAMISEPEPEPEPEAEEAGGGKFSEEKKQEKELFSMSPAPGDYSGESALAVKLAEQSPASSHGTSAKDESTVKSTAAATEEEISEKDCRTLEGPARSGNYHGDVDERNKFPSWPTLTSAFFLAGSSIAAGGALYYFYKRRRRSGG